MKFYNREKPLSVLRSFNKIVEEKGSRIIVVTGRRRIGKTRLVVEAFKEQNYLYFFVKKKRVNDLLAEWSVEIQETFGSVFYGRFQSFEALLTFLFEFSIKRQLTVVFDEVQNLLYSDSSAFGTVQKVFDLNREKSKLLLVFLGSSFSLMERIFKNEKEPLFGRAAEILTLSYLPVKSQEQILKDHGLYSGENLLHLFSLFDGVPKYIEDFIDLGKNSYKSNFKELLSTREIIWEEGENTLKEAFGKEYATYFSILSGIAKGRKKRNEIEQFTGISDAGVYLKNLEEIYKIIERKLPVTSRSRRDRKGRFYFTDNFLEFWFRYIETNRRLKELGFPGKAADNIWTGLSVYEGRKLEDLLIRKMIEENPCGLHFTRAGKYWDRRGKIEIDALFIDDEKKVAYLFEVKRNRRRITTTTLETLKKNAYAVPELAGFVMIRGISYITKEGLQIKMIDNCLL